MKEKKNRHSYMTWQLVIFVGFLVVVVQTSIKPVPDTTGTSFLFTIPYCLEDEPTSMYVVSQTTEAVNLTLTSQGSQLQFNVPSLGALRHNISCEDLLVNNTSKTAFRLKATGEIILYIEYPETSYIVFPDDVLSTRYTVASIFTSVFDVTFFTVIGNYTLLSLELPVSLKESVKINDTFYTPGARFNIYLENDEILLVSCMCDLSGIKISSSLPVPLVTGARNSSNTKLTIIQQLLPDSSWGRRFIFNRHVWMSDNITLNIIAKQRTTSVSVILKEHKISASISEQLKLSMRFVVSDFIAVETDKSVLCLVLVEIYDTSNKAHISMFNVPSLPLFPIKSFFHSLDNSFMSVDFVITLDSFAHVSFNTTSDLQPFSRPMTYFWNYLQCRNIEITSPYSVLINDKNIVPLFSVAVLRSAAYGRLYLMGMRITALYESCNNKPDPYGGNGDGYDNDCDNKIDEEFLNGKDDDGDGLVDEDTVYSGVIQQSHVDMAWAYYQKKQAENQETGIASSVVSILISISVGLSGVGCFIGFMFLIDKLKQRWESNTRVGPCT